MESKNEFNKQTDQQADQQADTKFKGTESKSLESKTQQESKNIESKTQEDSKTKKDSKKETKKVQLLSPAGNLEKLKIALDFGADAVYGGVSHFSLRNRSSKDFSLSDFQKGIDYAHKKNKKVYVTINGFPFNSQIESLKNHIALMRDLRPDAFIVAAPGVIKLAKQIAPNVPIHLSTQANVLNVLDAQVFYDMGVKRIVAAREISLNDCITIKEQIPQLEIEIFVHGSMCFAFSGRCLISALQHGRVPNRGSCANDCRFDYEYYVRDFKGDLVRFSGDEMYVKNPDNGVIMRLEQEQEIGTHIFNAKDLNLASELNMILESGVIDALKIEGRTKSSYYAGLTARTYALALSDFYARRGSRDSLYQYELHTLKHRGFTQGYIVHRPFSRLDTQNTMSAISDGDFQVCAEVDSSGSFGLCKHTLRAGQWAEIIAPLSYYKNSDFGVKFPFVSESFVDSKSDFQGLVTAFHSFVGGKGGAGNAKQETSLENCKKDSIESSLDSNKSLPSKKIKTQILESFIQTSALQNNFLNECQNEIGQIICVENRYYIKLNKIITINANIIESSILDTKNLGNIESNSQDSKDSKNLDSIKSLDSKNLHISHSPNIESKTTKNNNLEIIKTKDSITFKNIPYKQLDSIHSGNTSYILLPFTLPPFTFLRIKA